MLVAAAVEMAIARYIQARDFAAPGRGRTALPFTADCG